MAKQEMLAPWLNGKEKKLRVLIIDAGAQQSLPMIKGFHLLGCHVTVYSSNWFDAARHYKYTDGIVKGIADINDEAKTTQSIINVVSSGGYDLVVPMEDYFATILAKHKDYLKQFAKIYVNDWNIYKIAIDKIETMSVCMESGIPCPKTSVGYGPKDLESTFSFPLVVKPRTSFGARGFHVVYNEKELLDIFMETEKLYGPTLIQEYIPQTGKQYQVEMFMGTDGDCKAFVLMDKVRWYPIEGGSSTCNVTIHDEEIKQSCIKLLKQLKWKGYASLDLIRDPRDNKAKIMEINPRINGTAKICYAAGVDLSLLILQEMFNDTIDSQLDYKDGIVLRYFHKDILWFVKSRQRFGVKPSWFSFKNTVDEIFGWDDLRPAMAFTFASLRKLIKQNV